MNCIAVDDEPLALELIEDFCSRISFINIIALCYSSGEAMEVLEKQPIDFMFVDINMPQISGLDFVRSLSKPPLIIFTTAYHEHAAIGFELDAIDYLVKPIPFDRFLKAVNKVKEIHVLRSRFLSNADSDFDISASDDFIIIKVEYSTVKVNLKDILYIEGVKDYIKIKLDNKSYLTRSSMKNINEKLPSQKFVRVQKSYIVSLSKIEKIENNRIVFGEKRIPIGEQYKESFYKTINKKRL